MGYMYHPDFIKNENKTREDMKIKVPRGLEGKVVGTDHKSIL